MGTTTTTTTTPAPTPAPTTTTTTTTITSTICSECIFCKIIAGQIPSHKIYESENTFVFMDINPLAPFHVLLIPKYHAERTHQVPESVMQEMGIALSKTTKAVVEVSNCKDYNILQNNGDIAHQAV